MVKRERELLQLARAHGYRLARRRRHWAICNDAGDLIAIAAVTPGTRDLHILAADLRRAARRHSIQEAL
jgi:hypothetical protein